MLYSLLYGLTEHFFPFNVFRYITFRTTLAIITSAGIALFIGPYVIRRLKSHMVVQTIRQDGPETHLSKEGTPTMGGIVMVVAIFTSVLMWGDLSNPYIIVMLTAFGSFSLIGFYDDYLKLVKKHPGGLKARYKFGAQVMAALAIAAFLYFNPYDRYADMLSVPFLKKWLFDLGIFYVPFSILVIVGSSNAVNLTDGVDGLAAGLVAVAALANAMLVYISGHVKLAEYLYVLHLPLSGELTVFCGAMFGASLGFLWYNAYPAEVFMGDVGSLGLGGALGTLAVITKQEIVLAVVGGIFVMETISVVLQVGSYKLRKKRIFRMAPIHHHFELKGWPEPKVSVRFWIIGVLLAMLSLATLKLR